MDASPLTGLACSTSRANSSPCIRRFLTCASACSSLESQKGFDDFFRCSFTRLPFFRIPPLALVEFSLRSVVFLGGASTSKSCSGISSPQGSSNHIRVYSLVVRGARNPRYCVRVLFDTRQTLVVGERRL